jgi:MoxR-like ATPase
MNLETSRIQFTNDLLPADILGSSIFRAESNAFVFHRGPIFAQLVLADELNRSTPKTQSACLQAMEERAVSIDGVTYELPQPFFLVATQNPRQQIGTFALPESQLDRFLMRIEMGFPSREAERRLLKGENREQLAGQLLPVLAQGELRDMQQACRQIHTSDAVLTYIQNLVEKTRSAKSEGQGLSPRGALALTRASQAWAYLQRRSLVLPEDVQAVAVAVMSHRLNHTDDLSGQSGVRRALDILSTVSVD